MEEERLGFIKRLIIAVSRPKEYWITISQGGNRVIGFIAILLIFTTFCGFPLDYIKANIQTNGFKDIVKDNVPDFHIEDGILTMDEIYALDEDGTYIYIDSSYDEFTYDEAKTLVSEYDYDQVFLMGARKGIMYSNEKYKELDMSKLGTFTLNKDRLISFMKVVNGIAIVCIIVLYIGIFAWYLFMSLIYAIIGSLLKRVLGIGSEVSFNQIFFMAISAKVTMRIILAVCKLFNLQIPYFNLLCFIVTLGYLFIALMGFKEHKMQEIPNMGYGMQPDQNYNSNNGNNYMNQNYYDQTFQDSVYQDNNFVPKQVDSGEQRDDQGR